MKCYTHNRSSAVGICKSCYKAVCRECAIEIPNGLVCSAECKERINELNQVVERSFKVYGIGKYKSKIPATGVIIWALFALVAWGVFLMSYIAKGEYNSSNLIMAVIFSIILGLVVYSSKRTGIKC